VRSRLHVQGMMLPASAYCKRAGVAGCY